MHLDAYRAGRIVRGLQCLAQRIAIINVITGNRAEIGYVGDATVQGQGLMREAVLAVLDFAFELGFARVEAISELSNHRALHFAQSLGMVREGTLHHRERGVHGELVDQALFAAWPDPVLRAPG